MIGRARLVAAMLGLGLAAPAGAEVPLPARGPAAAPGTRPAAKKDAVALAKAPRQRATPVPGRRPPRLINVYNLWTKEWLAYDPAAPPAATTIDRFLRDHFTNQATAMQPQLLKLAVAAAIHFRRDVVHVVSAFRHPKYNLILRKKGRQVARDSQHSQGHALDFRVPGVGVAQLHAWARAQHRGGVGLYPDSGFIHMDTGPVRTWSGD